MNMKRDNENAGVVRAEKLFSAALATAVIAVILVLNVIFYYLTISLSLYIVPGEKDNVVLTGATDDLFEEAIAKKKTVKITFCMPEDDLKNDDIGSLVYKTATEYYNRYKSKNFIELEYINLITKRDADGNRVDLTKYTHDAQGEQINELRNNSVIFECGNNVKVVTDTYTSSGFYDFFTVNSDGEIDAYDGEEFMAGMIAWVLNDEHKKAYFTKTHSEQADPSFAKLLTMAGYETEIIDLRSAAVPEDADLLIISAPQSDFETASFDSSYYFQSEIGRLEAYMQRGGNVYVSLDPYVKKLTALEGLLAKYGISISETTLDDGTVVRDIVKDTANSVPSTNGYTIITEHADDNTLAAEVEATVSKYSDGRVIVREAGALSLTGSAKALLVSSSSAKCENGGVVTDSEGSYPIAAYNTFVAEGGREEANLFVCSSIYLSVSSALVTNGYSNKDFIYATFEHLFGTDSLPYGCDAVLYDTQTLENITMSAANLYTFMFMAVPIAVALTGAVVLIRRKNR